MLNYIKDFCKLFEYIERKKLGELSIKNNELYIKKNEFMKLLEVNNYDTPKNKLKFWRALGFINTSGSDRFTKIMRKGNEINRYIALNYEAYKTIKELQND